MPAEKNSSAMVGVSPKPCAAFSALTMMQSGSSSALFQQRQMPHHRLAAGATDDIAQEEQFQINCFRLERNTEYWLGRSLAAQ